MRSIVHRFILSSAFVAIVFAAAPTLAQVYKWVDGKGVVNYSNEAPANRNATLLDPKSARVSTYSTDDAKKPAPAPLAGADERALSDKIDRLERTLDAERYARRVQMDAQMQTAAEAWYAQCLRDRRVDCDYAGMDPYAYAPYYGPVVVAGPRAWPRPIVHRNVAAPRPAGRAALPPARSMAARQM